MKVKDLIELLGKAEPEDIVKIYDPDAEAVLPVTGMTFGAGDGEAQLWSDTD